MWVRGWVGKVFTVFQVNTQAIYVPSVLFSRFRINYYEFSLLSHHPHHWIWPKILHKLMFLSNGNESGGKRGCGSTPLF